MRRRLTCHQPEVEDGVRSLLAELDAGEDFGDPSYSSVTEEAQAAAERGPETPWWHQERRDLTEIPFLTIDPLGARDLDQALHLDRVGRGWSVTYAIADVAAFVTPGGAIDVEAWRRGETWYAPGHTRRLHPPALSEAAASLLPGGRRPALVWQIALDEALAVTGIRLDRAWVRSRQQLDYATVQARIDAGTAGDLSPSLPLLAELGAALVGQGRARGAVTLPLPDQEVAVIEGRWHLEYRAQVPVEEWNAQISLLTGRCAATLMARGGQGIVRTLPPAAAADLAALRRTAISLGVPWPESHTYPAFMATLDPHNPAHAAVAVASTRTLRGSGYAVLAGKDDDVPQHSAIAAPYAHVTAPLRRLVDRYALECCLAQAHDVDVPGWVLEALPLLPQALQRTGSRAGSFERGVLDLVEAALLRDRVGEVFAATVTSRHPDKPERGTVMLHEPAVEAPVVAESALPLGEHTQVRLIEADVAKRAVRFALA